MSHLKQFAHIFLYKGQFMRKGLSDMSIMHLATGVSSKN